MKANLVKIMYEDLKHARDRWGDNEHELRVGPILPPTGDTKADLQRYFEQSREHLHQMILERSPEIDYDVRNFKRGDTLASVERRLYGDPPPPPSSVIEQQYGTFEGSFMPVGVTPTEQRIREDLQRVGPERLTRRSFEPMFDQFYTRSADARHRQARNREAWQRIIDIPR